MNLREASTRTYEVCVVGNGPAGIIFVLEYTRLNPNHRILIIEFGHRRQSVNNSLDQTIVLRNSGNHHDPSNSADTDSEALLLLGEEGTE